MTGQEINGNMTGWSSLDKFHVIGALRLLLAGGIKWLQLETEAFGVICIA